jgi:hypothetical protein
MAIFHERTERDGKVVIRYKNMRAYFAALAGCTVLTAAALVYGGPFYLAAPALAAVVALNYLDMRNARMEIRAAMERGKVSVSGSRFSAGRPLTVEFPAA